LNRPGDPLDNEVSIRWLAKSIIRNIVDGLKRNKLATILAAITLAVSLVLAFDSRFDGVSDYQEFILPRLLRLETGFHRSLRAAEHASGEWRSYYFENAHAQVRDILRAARLERPGAHVARQKHREFIRYWESIHTAFHTIATKTTIDPNLDYVHELAENMRAFKPIRDAWAAWTEQPSDQPERPQ
jgi:hypothetical protein